MTDEPQLDAITRLLEDLLILEGLKAGMGLEAVRKLVGVDKKRVNRVSTLFKTGKNA